jgi:pentatricopeptide repeat protein
MYHVGRGSDEVLTLVICIDELVVQYSTIIDSLCKDRLVHETLTFFSQMTNRGIQPDIFTYNSLIQSLCNYGRW